MEYKLINDKLDPTWDLIEKVFYNRGFELDEIERYLHTNDESIYDPELLDNMK